MITTLEWQFSSCKGNAGEGCQNCSSGGRDDGASTCWRGYSLGRHCQWGSLVQVAMVGLSKTELDMVSSELA